MAERVIGAPEAATHEPARSRWTRQVIGPFTVRHIALLLGALVLGAVLLLLLGLPVARPAAPAIPAPGSGFYPLGDPTQGPAVGQLAPELTVATDGAEVPIRDLDGEPIRLADRRGEPVWLSFFGTWCPPCQEETPVLRDAHARHADAGLNMVAISVLDTTADDLRAYADMYSLPYTIGFDAASDVFRAYQGFGLPTHVFLDREGIVRLVHYGPLRAEEVDAIVEPLLAR